MRNPIRLAIVKKKAIDSNPDTAEKERLKEVFKQSKYALLKPEESLTEKQKLKLEEIKEVSPILQGNRILSITRQHSQ